MAFATDNDTALSVLLSISNRLARDVPENPSVEEVEDLDFRSTCCVTEGIFFMHAWAQIQRALRHSKDHTDTPINHANEPNALSDWRAGQA